MSAVGKSVVGVAVLVFAMAGCSESSSDAKQPGRGPNDLMTPVAPGSLSGDDLVSWVQQELETYLSDLGESNTEITSVTCDDLPEIRAGATSDCEVRTTAPPPDDDVRVRLTVSWDLESFDWEVVQ